MGNYARPKNPQVVPKTGIRIFDGIGGPQTQILKRFNFKGWDISSTVANNVSDFHLGEVGTMLLRPGFRRLGSESYTIGWIGQVRIGGLLRYGIIYNNSLQLVDFPRLGYGEIEWPEDDPEKPSDLPTGWIWIDTTVDNYPIPDPSLPEDGQICSNSYEWDSDPDTISFTMAYPGADLPASQNWYWKCEGYRPQLIVGYYNTDPAWLDTFESNIMNKDIGPCHGVQINRLNVSLNSAAQALAAGAYSFTKNITLSDGTTLSVVVGLTIYSCVVTVSPSSLSWIAWSGTYVPETKTINIAITGQDGVDYAWTATVTGDLASYISLSASSGTITSGSNQDITVTLTSSTLSEGTYTGTITISSPGATDQTVDLSVTIVGVYTGDVVVYYEYTLVGGGSSSGIWGTLPHWSGGTFDGKTILHAWCGVPPNWGAAYLGTYLSLLQTDDGVWHMFAPFAGATNGIDIGSAIYLQANGQPRSALTEGLSGNSGIYSSYKIRIDSAT